MEKRIEISVCLGTTCHLMGASHFQTLYDDLPANLRDNVQIHWKRCLDYCKRGDHGQAPYVVINGEVVSDASLPRIVERIETLLQMR